RTRLGITPRLVPGGLYEHGVEPLPQSAVGPTPEVPIHRLPGRKIPGQHAPLTPRARDVENRVEDQPHCPLARTAPEAHRKEVHHLLPFSRSQIGWVNLREGNHPSNLPDRLQNTLLGKVSAVNEQKVCVEIAGSSYEVEPETWQN